MNIRPSTALRNEYPTISKLARATGEPIYITNKGEADIVILSTEAYEMREKVLKHRADILEAELSRVSGAKTCSLDEVRDIMRERFLNA